MSTNPSDLVTDSSNQSEEVPTQTTVLSNAWFNPIEQRLVQEIDKIIDSTAKDCIDHEVERQRWENVRSIVLQTDHYDLPSNIRGDAMFLFKGLIYRLYQTLKSNHDEIDKFIRPACRFYEVNLDLIIEKFVAMTDRDKKLKNAAGKVVVMHQLGYTEEQIVQYTKLLVCSIDNEIDLTRFVIQDPPQKSDYDNGAECFDELFGKALAENLQESLPTLLSPQEQQALDNGDVVDKTYNGAQMSDLSQFERMTRIKSYVKKTQYFDRLSAEAKDDTIHQFDLIVNTMRDILLEDNSQEFINGFVQRAGTVTNRDVKAALDQIESMSEEQKFLNAVREGIVSLQQLGQYDHIEAYKQHMIDRTNRDLITGELVSTEDTTNLRAVVKCLQQLKAVLKSSDRTKAFNQFVDAVDAAVLKGSEIRDLACIKKIFVEAMVNGTYNDAQLEKMIDVYINKYSQSQSKVTTPTVTPVPNPPVVVTPTVTPKATSVTTTSTPKPAVVTPTVTAKIKRTSNRTKVKTFTGTKRRRVDTQPPVYQQPPTYQQPPVYQQPPTYQQPPVYQQPPTYQQPPVYQQPPTYQQPPVYQQPPTYQQPPLYQQLPLYVQTPLYQQQQQVQYVPQIVGYVPIYAPSRL